MSVATAPSAEAFLLPDLGEGLTEAEVMEWHVAVGDEVVVDQVVVTVETAKATVDLPCPHAGRVHQLHGEPGQMLAVGAPLLSVATAGSSVPDGPGAVAGERTSDDPGALAQYREEEQAGSGAVLIGYGTAEGKRTRRRRVGVATATASATPAGPASPPAPVSSAPTTGPTTSTAVEPATGPARAVQVISPIVRRLARDHGVDLSTLTPGSPDEILRRRDVETAIARSREPSPTADMTTPAPTVSATPPPVPASTTARSSDDLHIPLRGVRRTIGDRMTTSRREIPDATTWVDADATALMEAKDAIRALRPDAGIGVLALMARIVVAGLHRFPELNARVDTEHEEIVQLARVNLGFAAQSPRGLVVPVVHDAGSMTTSELAGALRELTDLARRGALTPAQMTGGTFTLNNYGVFGVDGSTPIINHPEAAMLGVGRIIDKPWAHEGQVALRKVTQLSFTFDHRVCDGGTAGGFLRFVADGVERPVALLADL
jgi:pyruvate dehydrogenase E2 component (dihydrolipoamide acetyltransferase)